MPKKKRAESEAEQGARFKSEVEKLIAAGELSTHEADAALDRMVRGQKSPPRAESTRAPFESDRFDRKGRRDPKEARRPRSLALAFAGLAADERFNPYHLRPLRRGLTTALASANSRCTSSHMASPPFLAGCLLIQPAIQERLRTTAPHGSRVTRLDSSAFRSFPPSNVSLQWAISVF